MARFAESFIQGLMNPTYQQGLFTAAQGAGSFPRRQREAEEKQRQDKGQMGGILAAQQAASEGRFDPETQKAFMGSMQGLGMSPEDILKNVNTFQSINQQAEQQIKTKTFVESLGSQYADLYAAGSSLKDVRTQHLQDSQQKAFASLISNLDIEIDSELAQQMTAKQLFDIMEDKKRTTSTAQANRNWATWVKNNPSITDANRQEGLTTATEVFGADAPAKLAELESKYLSNESKKQNKKIVKGVISLNSDSMFADLPGMENKSNLKSVELAIDDNGNLTDESIKFLENNATSAFIPSINKSWAINTSSKKTDDILLGNSTSSTPSGQGKGGSTLGQVVGPDVLNQALTDLEFQ